MSEYLKMNLIVRGSFHRGIVLENWYENVPVIYRKWNMGYCLLFPHCASERRVMMHSLAKPRPWHCYFEGQIRESNALLKAFSLTIE